jgi:hypothetical protein
MHYGILQCATSMGYPQAVEALVSTKAKQIKIHRRVIQSLMSEWAYNHRTKTDTIFFEQKTIEDVINLRFNPSDGVATYRSDVSCLKRYRINVLLAHLTKVRC